MKVLKSYADLFFFMENELGIKKGDTVNIDSSPIDRNYKITIKYIPETKEELQAVIDTAPPFILKQMGIGIWKSYQDCKKHKEIPPRYLGKDMVHYLYPKEWYNFLPEGINIIDISGKVEKFKRGFTDDDARYSCLAYGFVRKEK